jgi:hypothetical protein
MAILCEMDDIGVPLRRAGEVAGERSTEIGVLLPRVDKWIPKVRYGCSIDAGQATGGRH